jgi:hypothetical protein
VPCPLKNRASNYRVLLNEGLDYDVKPSSPTSKSSARPCSHSRLRTNASPSGRFKTGDMKALHLNRTSLTSTTACNGVQKKHSCKHNNGYLQYKGKRRQLDAHVSSKPRSTDAPRRENSSRYDNQHSFAPSIVEYLGDKVRCVDVLMHYKGSANIRTATQEERGTTKYQVADYADSHWSNR